MVKAITPEEFLEKARAVWGDRWDYSETVYRAMRFPVTIICRDHGPFDHGPQTHLKGLVGCGECNGQKPITREEFIRRAEDKHGKGAFDYSEVVLGKGGIHQKVDLICGSHKIKFNSSAWSFLSGRNGCWRCRGKNGYTKEVFLHRAQETWPDKAYDYSRIDYSLSLSQKAEIGCPVEGHGFFKQTLHGHVSGREGCPKCDSANRRTTPAQFISMSKAKWGDKYSYELLELNEGTKQKLVTLTCIKHSAPFTYRADRHLLGLEGCPSCRTAFGPSKGEQELAAFVESLGLTVERHNRKLLKGKEIDIFIPELNLGLEYHGLYYHSEKFMDRNAHYRKWELAQEAGIRLLQLWEDDWQKRRPVVEAHLRHVMGKSEQSVAAARRCEVRPATVAQARQFLETHHIQGFVSATVYLGLWDGDELVALALFLKGGGDYTLVRYATSKRVPGGHGKLVAAFERNYGYGKLVTFADLMFSDGGLYRSTGWTEDKFLRPDYSYVVNGERVHKFTFRKKRFESDPEWEFKPGLTEVELAALNGLERVWDSGKIRFVRVKPVE